MVSSDNADHLGSVVEMTKAAVSVTRKERGAEVYNTKVSVQSCMRMNIIAVGKIFRTNRQLGKPKSDVISQTYCNRLPVPASCC